MNIPFSEFPLKDVGHGVNLAGSVYESNDKAYLIALPSYTDGRPLYVVDHVSVDDWNAIIKQSDEVMTEVLRQHDGELVKVLMRKCERQISMEVQWQVFRRDGYRCRYCGADDRPLTVDHLVLWEEGGPSTDGNLLASCKKCNKARGRMQYADWLNSPYFADHSRKLTYPEIETLGKLRDTLANIPRFKNIRSR